MVAFEERHERRPEVRLNRRGMEQNARTDTT